MSMQYIRDHYSVPAKRGGRIRYSGDGVICDGTIVGARNQYLRVAFDDLDTVETLHPVWEVEYLPEDGDSE